MYLLFQVRVRLAKRGIYLDDETTGFSCHNAIEVPPKAETSKQAETKNTKEGSSMVTRQDSAKKPWTRYNSTDEISESLVELNVYI